MGWKLTKPVRKTELHEFRPTPNVVFYVDDHGTERWRNVMLDAGGFTDESTEECLKKWPREAIRRLRAELDKIERLLNEREKEVETVV